MEEKILCGVDLGGTKLSAGLFSEVGEPLHEAVVKDHAHLDCRAMTRRIAELTEQLFCEAGVQADQVRGIGVGMAGHIRTETGTVVTTSNFSRPFINFPLRDELVNLLRLPIILDNDANAQALGEHLFGAGRGRDDIVFLTVSTGIGAGIISGGKIFRGHWGLAGEVGHTIIEPSSPVRCGCGRYGCLMALTGTLGLPFRYRLCREEGMKAELSLEEEQRLNGELLEKGVKMGDEIALRLFCESAAYLGIGIYNIFQTYNPQTVILGGGLMRMGHGFFGLIQEKFTALAGGLDDMEIIPAELGGRSGLLGAASLLLEDKGQ